MSFYSKLVFDQKDANKLYTIAVAGKTYRLDTKTADVEYDESDKLLIFTTSDNYRVAVNTTLIATITWIIPDKKKK